MDSLSFKDKNLDSKKDSFLSKRSFADDEINRAHKCQTYVFGQKFDVDDADIIKKVSSSEIERDDSQEFGSLYYEPSNFFEDESGDYRHDHRFEDNDSPLADNRKSFGFMKWSFAILATSFLVAIFLSGGLFINKGMNIKNQVLGVSDQAIDSVNDAIYDIKESNFETSSDNFEKAYDNFTSMSNSLEDLGVATISLSRFVPGASKLSSGYELTQAGKHLSLAGKKISSVASDLGQLKENSFGSDENEGMSALSVFRTLEEEVASIEEDLVISSERLEKVNLKDIPKDKRSVVRDLKIKLPIIMKGVNEFSRNSHIVADLLGANGPRKYLFLFQNNQEMRATGGFIGSYGLLDIAGDGRIRNFFVDGIFNPDGQLTDKIIPPKPIQKISAAWSLHDSNWFPHFPLSAQKAISFYEKTGGPTVDGVVTLTPTVMQKLMKVTGPIYMEEYDVELTSENFIKKIQYEVEEDYDKEDNRPKKILSDLAPIVLDRLLSSGDPETISETIKILGEALNEKHILIYSSNEELQQIISEIGWAGEIVETEKDYINIINSNINGYKTDGVIDESIEHSTEIGRDGVVVNTVKITRKHNGGNEDYEWWNKVNANYMRVYVPEGSMLLEVDGQTREFNESPLDYQALGFEEDKDVKREESNMQIDEVSGTRTYSENGKTVFANWVYVSPQEEVSLTYKYQLPFKVDLNSGNGFDSFSLLAQKQSGSLGDSFSYSLKYPGDWSLEWKSENIDSNELGRLEMDNYLEKDIFLGVIFSK